MPPRDAALLAFAIALASLAAGQLSAACGGLIASKPEDAGSEQVSGLEAGPEASQEAPYVPANPDSYEDPGLWPVVTQPLPACPISDPYCRPLPQ